VYLGRHTPLSFSFKNKKASFESVFRAGVNIKPMISKSSFFLGVFLILLLVSSCIEDNEDSFGEFKNIKSYTLSVPDDLAPNSWAQKFYSGNDERLLYYLNDDEQKLVVFDIARKSLVKEIELSQQGPNNVGEVFSFSVFSRDSIVLASGPFPFNFVINEDGGKVGKYDYSWNASYGQEPDFVSLESRYFTDFSTSNKFDYFVQRVPYRGMKPKKVSHRPIVKFNRSTKEYSLLDFKYPEEYWIQGLPDNLTFNHDEKSIFYGLTGDHNLYSIIKEDGRERKHFLKSKFAPDDMPTTSGFSSREDVMLYDAMTPRYTALIPDPYRKLYYRIVCLPPSDLSVAKAKPTQLHFYPDRFSIMVLDQSMKVKFETAFPEKQYFPHGIFIDEEGIHIPKTHPEFFVALGRESEFLYDVFVPNF
jgi:hypothetical protein